MRLFALVALLAATSLAHATETPTPTPAAETAKKAEGEKVTKLVCKLEKPVGSQMLKRRCYTQDQVDFDRETAQRELPYMQK